jgi:hypothetical protein
MLHEIQKGNRMKKSKSAAKAKRMSKAKRHPFPYAKVAALWAEGKTIAEIAKAIGRVGEGNDPYHALRVILTRMHRGYKNADGKIVKLPHRISRKTLRLATKAGKKAKAN